MSFDVSDLLLTGLLYLRFEVMRIQGGEDYWDSGVFQMRPVTEHDGVLAPEPNFTYGDLEVYLDWANPLNTIANRPYHDRYIIDMMIHCLKDLRLEGVYSVQLEAG